MGIRILVLLFTLFNSALAVTFDEAVDISINEACGTGINEVIYGLDDVLSEGTRVDGWWESVTLPYDGYLFLVDPAPDMLWGHDCTWAFVSRDGGTVTTYDMQTPPDTLFGDMAVVSGERFGAGLEPQPPFPAQMRFFDDDERLVSSEQFEGKRHALLISGGRDKETNASCFWGNIAFTYRTLVHYYGWNKSEITVCMSDGDDPAADRGRCSRPGYESSSVDLDGDGVQDYDKPADKGNVIAALENLTAEVEAGDLVFVLISNHGTRPPGWTDEEEVGVILWGPNPENNLWDYELADYLDLLPADAVKIVSVFSCYSGGFIDEIEDKGTENIVICTPCRDVEITPIGCYYLDTVHDWISAFNWATGDIYHYPSPVDADTDGDSICQVDEAFNWMVFNNNGSATPQWYDPDGIGENVTLYGNPNGPVVCFDSIDNNDDAPDGNGDGYFERGEKVAMYVALRNIGLSTAENVYVEIACDDDDIDVITGRVDFPDIEPGDSSTNSTPLLVRVKDSLKYNKAADIDIEYSFGANSPLSKSIFVPLIYDKGLIGLYDDVENRGYHWAEEGTGQWDIRDFNSRSPTHSRSYYSNGDYLVKAGIFTPPIILSEDINDNKLSLYNHYKFTGLNSGYIGINTGSGWVNIASYSSSTIDFEHVAIDLREFAGETVQFRFRVQTNSIAITYWYIDDVSIGALSTPSELDARNGEEYSIITWSYPGGDNVIGFNLYRREIYDSQENRYDDVNTNWVLINDDLITRNGQIKYVDYTGRAGSEYEYRLEAVLPSGRVICGYCKSSLAEENEDEDIPKTYSLSQNYPNPSSGVTIISFGLPEQTSVSLEAYDLKGRCVARLIEDRVMAPGIYSMDFDTSLLSEGIYIYRMETLDYSATKKLIVIH